MRRRSRVPCPGRRIAEAHATSHISSDASCAPVYSRLRVGCARKKMVMTASPGLLPHPESAVLYVMEALLAISGPVQMLSEATGKKNMSFSKFASAGKEQATVPSRTGMLVCYFPAAVVASAFLAYRVGLLPLAAALEALGVSGVAAVLENGVAAGGDQLLLVAAALSIHHVKRCLEVLFVHKPSGCMTVEAMGVISTSYFLQVCFLLYSQLLSAGADHAPSPDLKWLGVALFSAGILGNGYHHWMLAHLRKDGNKKYVVPRRGLFELFVCPHYIFEMMDYVGLALISQTLFGWCMASFTIFYLTGRSIATKEWYKKKLEGFPDDRSVLIPGIF